MRTPGKVGIRRGIALLSIIALVTFILNWLVAGDILWRGEESSARSDERAVQFHLTDGNGKTSPVEEPPVEAGKSFPSELKLGSPWLDGLLGTRLLSVTVIPDRTLCKIEAFHLPIAQNWKYMLVTCLSLRKKMYATPGGA